MAQRWGSAFGVLTVCLLSRGLAAQTLNVVDATASANNRYASTNRYIAASVSLTQQSYREIDQQGRTSNGWLNQETGTQSSIGLALRWQLESNLSFDLETTAQSGPTEYDGYLQAGNGSLTPYKARTGNVALRYSANLGYAFNAQNAPPIPVDWQVTPLLQLTRHYWQRNLAQYEETYRFGSHSAGLRIEWLAKPEFRLEAQFLSGKTQPASVYVPDSLTATQTPPPLATSNSPT